MTDELTELRAAVSRLEAECRRLSDLQELNALTIRYQRMCDGGWDGGGTHRDPDGLADLFTPDGEYSINPERPPCVGREAIREQFVRLQSTLPWIIHYLSNADIAIDGDAATGEVKCHALLRRDGGFTTVNGLYRARFARLADGWRFASWTFLFADVAARAGAESHFRPPSGPVRG